MGSTASPRGVDLPVVIAGTIAPTRLSPAYRLGLIVVAIAMLLLPMVYLGLIVLAALAVWWHLTGNLWILEGESGGLWSLLAYLGPAIAGVVVVFFLVKPVLARPERSRDPIFLDPDAEPVLFAFIEQICRQVRAPIPKRVQVDCRVNASAGFLPGRLGLFRRDLALTIGLPLVAGLSVRELGGVLAHEFGHFAQGGGMRLTALVRGINGWFGRVVYERDQWDERLERWATGEGSDWRLTIVLLMARASIWASRRVLNGLMIAGHAISCFMLRQMEYDADSYEVKFAGSAAFARTSARMRELGLGTQLGYADLRESWLNRTLPSNLPVFLIERSGRLPAEILSQVRAVPDHATRVFDTHPSDADRVRAAEALAAPGVLVGGDGPGTGLFRDFDGLSLAATRHHYEHDLGLSLEAATLVAIDDAIRDSTSRQENQQAVHMFVGERATWYRLFRVGVAEVAGLTQAELEAALGAARAAITEDVGVSGKYRLFESLETTRDHAFGAQEILGAGFDKVIATEFGLAEGTAEDALATEARAVEQEQELVQDLVRFEAIVARRLACGVRLLASEEALNLAGALNAVSDVQEHLVELRRLTLAESQLLHNQAASARADQMEQRLTQIGRRIAGRIEQVREGLGDVRCPPAVSAMPTTVAAWCGLSADGVAGGPTEVVSRALTLYWGSLGRLAALTLQVEARLPPGQAGPVG